MIESIARSYALRQFGIGSTAIAVRVPYAPQEGWLKAILFLFFYHYHIRANVYCVAYELCSMSAMSTLKHHATYPNRFAIFAR